MKPVCVVMQKAEHQFHTLLNSGVDPNEVAACVLSCCYSKGADPAVIQQMLNTMESSDGGSSSAPVVITGGQG